MVIEALAVYENGVLKLRQPLPLEDKAEVRVTIETQQPATSTDDSWKAIDSLVGSVHSGISDGAENHDQHLYNDPHA